MRWISWKLNKTIRRKWCWSGCDHLAEIRNGEAQECKFEHFGMKSDGGRDAGVGHEMAWDTPAHSSIFIG